jgi:hypothetical protein
MSVWKPKPAVTEAFRRRTERVLVKRTDYFALLLRINELLGLLICSETHRYNKNDREN